MPKMLSFTNVEIAQGYARVLRHPLEISVDKLPSQTVVSNNWRQSEMYIKNFQKMLLPGDALSLREIKVNDVINPKTIKITQIV